MIKNFLGVIFLTFAGFTFSQTSNPTKVIEPTIKQKLEPTVDSLNKALQRGQQLTNETKKTIDSIKELNDYMNKLLLSHDYRVYTYEGIRMKLIYKWRKGENGKRGYWHKVKEIHY